MKYSENLQEIIVSGADAWKREAKANWIRDNIEEAEDMHMYFYKEDLINLIVPDKSDPAAAKVLQETLGGRFGEMRTMMQFFFQSSNFRGKATQYRDLIRGVFGRNQPCRIGSTYNQPAAYRCWS